MRIVLRHRTGGCGGIAEEHRLDDEILVDGVRDRLAHLQVGQFLAAMVDLDDELIGQPLITLGDHLEARHLGDAVEVGQRHGGEGGELDFFGFQRAGGRGAVRQHLIDDLVEIGLVLAPIVGVLRQPVILAGLVFGEFERTGADGRVVGRVRRDVADLVDVLRHDAAQRRQRVADQLERRRLGEFEHGGEIVRRVDGGQILEHGAAKILQRLPDLQRREGDVGGGEGLAVMPFDAVAQFERHRQAVGGTFPAQRQSWLEPVLAVEGGLGQRFDDLAGDEEDAVGGNDRRVEIARLGIGGKRPTGRPSSASAPSPIIGMAVEASSIAEPASIVRLEIVKSDMIELRPLRDPAGRAIPLGPAAREHPCGRRLWALPRVSPETELAHPCLALKISSAGPVWRKRFNLTYLVGPDWSV